MKLKSNNGMVEYIMATGKDFVKSQISESAALQMIANGETKTTTTHKGFPLCVDGKYYFPEVPEPAAETGSTKTSKTKKTR